jgi:hypothetical protein
LVECVPASDCFGPVISKQRRRLVKHDGCGGHMRGRYARSKSRVLRSCNLLPNVPRPIVSDSSVLRLVVSVANSWGNLRRLVALLDRWSGRSWDRLVAANRTCLSRCLDDAIFHWSAPAPAAQGIVLSTRRPIVWPTERPASGLTQMCDLWLVSRELPCGPRLLKEC